MKPTYEELELKIQQLQAMQCRKQLDIFPEPISLWSEGGILLFINEKAAYNLHSEPSLLIGKSFFDIYESNDTYEAYWAKIQKVLQTGITDTYENEAEINSEIRYFSTSINRIEHLENKSAVQTIDYDITEQKHFETALRESEQRFRDMTELLPQILYEADLTGTITYSNRQGFSSFGYTQDDFRLGINLLSTVIPEDRPKVLTAMSKIIDGSATPGHTFTAERRDGSTIPVLIYSTAIRSGKRVVGFRGLIVDITEHRKVQDDLLNSEIRFRSLFEQAAVGVAIVESVTGKYVKVNSKYSQIIGYSINELLKLTVQQITYSDDWQEQQRNMDNLFHGKTHEFNMDKRYLRKDESIVWVNLSVSPLWTDENKPDYHIAIVQDITQKKQSDNEKEILLEISKLLLATETLKQTFVELSGILTKFDMPIVAIELFDEVTNEMVVVGQAGMADDSEMLRTPVNQSLSGKVALTGEAILEVNINNRHEAEFSILKQLGVETFLCVPMKKKGRVMGTLSLVDSSERKDAKVLASTLETIANFLAQEIDRKQVAEQLTESQEQTAFLAEILERSSQPFVVGHADGKMSVFNQAFAQLVGYEKEELMHINWVTQLTPPEWLDMEIKLVRALGDNGVPVYYEKEYMRKDGTRIPVEFLTDVYKDAAGNILNYYAFVTNISERKQAQKALRESEEKYRLLFTGINNGFSLCEIMLDEDGKPNDYRFLSINPAFEQLTGLKSENVIGRTIREVVPIIEDYWIEIYGKVALTGDMVQFENYFSGLNKHFNITVYSYQKGTFAVIFEDITQRKLAEEELFKNRKLLRHLIDSLPLLIACLDLDGKYLIANNSHIDAFLLSLDLIEGHNVKEFLSAEFYETQKSLLDSCIQTGKVVTWEGDYDFDEGKTTYLYGIYSPLYDRNNNLWAVSYAILDTTEQKQLELQLTQYAKQLADANATKDKFFSIIGHDLRNPFNALIGLCEYILDNLNDISPSDIEENTKIMLNSANSGYSLLENLLEWARSQTGNIVFAPTPINLYENVIDCIEIVYHQSFNKDVNIQNLVAPDLYINADKNLLMTILRNLLTNAIKYSYRKGNVIIRAIEYEKHIEVSVQDFGLGISQEMIDKLFRIDFKNSNKGTERETGTGLGLILCKEFVEKHGGTIWVKSEEEKGSEFIFSLPK